MNQSNNSAQFLYLPSRQQIVSQQKSAINLFVLQSNQDDQILLLRSESKFKNLRKFIKRKTPSEILKENILKNRQNNRIKSLRTITSDNIKLFMRLQDQKSSYKFAEIHKQLSCSILPFAKSNITSQNSRRLENEGQTFTRNSRCQSAETSLKNRCCSLKHNIGLTNGSSKATINFRNNNGVSINTARIFAAGTTSKLSIFTDKNEKENVMENKLMTSRPRQLNYKQEQKIIMRKIGIKIPIDKPKLLINQQKATENIANRNFNIKNRPQSSDRLKRKHEEGVLSEQRIQTNII